MILSHRHKFIFIKTRKVSGTSMEISLSKFCGEDDVITPISYEDELVRLDAGGRLPQHYGDPKEQQFRDLILERKSDVRRVRHKGQFYNHVPAVDVRAAVGRDVWDEYFTFSMERHPYEKVVSLVYYHARDKNRWDFDRELKKVLKKDNYVNYPVYSDGESRIVDYIANYEKLGDELRYLSERLGFDLASSYPRTKHKHRSDRRPARELLSDAAKEEIFRKCRVEFEALGFER